MQSCKTIFHKIAPVSVPKCLADNSAVVPHCPGSEVSIHCDKLVMLTLRRVECVTK